MGYRGNMFASNHIIYDCAIAPLRREFSTRGVLAIRARSKMNSLKSFTKLCAIGLACIPIFSATVSQASPFATEVIAHSKDLNGSSDFNDPNAMLGKPTTSQKYPGYTYQGKTYKGTTSKTKVCEGVWKTNSAGKKAVTQFKAGSWAVVKFGQKVRNDKNNPFGIDLIVFGNNSMTVSPTSAVNDSTNMNNTTVKGNLTPEQLKISVSQGYTGAAGQKKDDQSTWTWKIIDMSKTPFFTTQGYQWDAKNAKWTNKEMDFTKPVDPSLVEKKDGAFTFKGGDQSAANIIKKYKGSGGGAGIDLSQTGLSWIQYVKVSGTGGSVDGFADVSAVPEPATLALLTIGGLAIIRRRKAKAC